MRGSDSPVLVRRTATESPGQRLVRALAVALLLTSVAAGSFAAPVAAASDPVFVTGAQGLVDLGPGAPAWSAGQLEIDEGDAMGDPAGDAAGFLLVTDGDVLVESGTTGRRSLVSAPSALFIAAGDGATFTAIDDGAEAWRIAVVAEGNGTPIDGGEVERLIETTGPSDANAPDNAVRSIELRIAAFDDGDDANIGDDDESIAFGCALEGRFDLVDESVREGRCEVAPGADDDGEIALSGTDDDTLAAVIVAGPALDPDSLTAANRDDEGDDAPEPKPTATKPPADTGDDEDTGGDDGGNGNGGDEEAPPDDGGTDLTDLDSDGDDLNDQFEIDNGTNPNKADSDDDGLTDRQELIELQLNTDPNNPDTDADGLPDGTEIDMSTGFFTRPDMPDTDGDGLFDSAELGIGADPTIPDTDGDGLLDLQEAQGGCNPNVADSDGDGITDGIEVLQMARSCIVFNQ